MDPRDVLGIELHVDAAMPSPHDARDHQWDEVAFGAAPFDWNKGYDIEKEMSSILGSNFTEPTKNQGQSGSCGGQAASYLGGTFTVFQNKNFVEKSAKFIYAPIAYPGGGTIGRDLCDRVINTGWSAESLCVSYENGNPPSEAFMVRVQDITTDANTDAGKDRAISYASVSADIDSVAQALANSKGLFLGVVGQNNGTWLSPNPKPPVIDGGELWGHWLKAGKARLNPTTNKKEIGVHNSWGATVGENGWQWLDEDYFATVLSNAASRPGPVIFEAWVIQFNPASLPVTSFRHTFTKQMDIYDTGSEVVALQDALKIDGDFPMNVASTGYYGNITTSSVQKFQKKYGIATGGTPTTTGYGRVGPKTLAQLNKLFGA